MSGQRLPVSGNRQALRNDQLLFSPGTYLVLPFFGSERFYKETQSCEGVGIRALDWRPLPPPTGPPRKQQKCGFRWKFQTLEPL